MTPKRDIRPFIRLAEQYREALNAALAWAATERERAEQAEAALRWIAAGPPTDYGGIVAKARKALSAGDKP